MIALIAAVPLETNLLRRSFSPCEVRNCGGRDLFLGARSGLNVVLLHSGVGKANAAAATSSLLGLYRPAAVIVVGCGGALPGSGLEVGDLAVASEEIYGDEGVLAPDGFLDMEAIQLPLVKRNGHCFYNHYPTSPPLLEKTRTLLNSGPAGTSHKTLCGPFVTVSTCSGTLAGGIELVQRTNGICENMEGAAVAQVCAMHHIPFLEIRGISNLVENRDTSKWNLKGGAEIAQRAVQEILGNWDHRKESA
jgi:futalosine hydrolase